MSAFIHQHVRPRWPDWNTISVENILAEPPRITRKASREAKHKNRKREQNKENDGMGRNVKPRWSPNFICRTCGVQREFFQPPKRCPFCGRSDVWRGKKGLKTKTKGRGKDAKTQVDEGVSG